MFSKTMSKIAVAGALTLGFLTSAARAEVPSLPVDYILCAVDREKSPFGLPDSKNPGHLAPVNQITVDAVNEADADLSYEGPVTFAGYPMDVPDFKGPGNPEQVNKRLRLDINGRVLKAETRGQTLTYTRIQFDSKVLDVDLNTRTATLTVFGASTIYFKNCEAGLFQGPIGPLGF